MERRVIGARRRHTTRATTATKSDHDHDHGTGGHSHELPEGPRPMSPRGLIALALAGGILPAPSALLVMLGGDQRAPCGLRRHARARVQRRTRGVADRDRHGALKAREVMAERLSSTAGRLLPCCRRRRSSGWACSCRCGASPRSDQGEPCGRRVMAGSDRPDVLEVVHDLGEERTVELRHLPHERRPVRAMQIVQT